jgi:aminoglycoside phosphotransferase (APT) family kinase protein
VDLIDPLLQKGRGRLSERLARQLVEIARPGHKAGPVWWIGEGVKAVSWLIEVEGAEPVVAKFFRPESQDRMTRELAFHAACTLSDPRLPVLLGSQEAILGEQLGVVLTNCLMGQRLADDSGATEADKREVYVEAGKFLRELHTVGQTGFGPLGEVGLYKDARAMAKAQIDTAREKRELIGCDAEETERIASWAGERADALSPEIKPVLCHGDFSMWNMLVEWRGNRHVLSGVFDFESAYAGDPLMELASAWVLTDSWGSPRPEDLAALNRGYGAREEAREADFELYVALEKLKLWRYFAERGAKQAAADVNLSLARQIER